MSNINNNPSRAPSDGGQGAGPPLPAADGFDDTGSTSSSESDQSSQQSERAMQNLFASALGRRLTAVFLASSTPPQRVRFFMALDMLDAFMGSLAAEVLEQEQPRPVLPHRFQDIVTDQLELLQCDLHELELQGVDYINVCNAMAGQPTIAGVPQEAPQTAGAVIAAFTNIFPSEPNRTDRQTQFLGALETAVRSVNRNIILNHAQNVEGRNDNRMPVGGPPANNVDHRQEAARRRELRAEVRTISRQFSMRNNTALSQRLRSFISNYFQEIRRTMALERPLTEAEQVTIRTRLTTISRILNSQDST